MMYKSNFVVSIKVSNKYIREEDEDKVKIPFGSEYSLYLKNMDSRKAVVKVSVDGKNVTDNGIVVHGNSGVDLNGFIENGELKNKFKFIKVTDSIKEFRGEFPEDSLIRVEVFWEKKKVEIPYTIYTTPRWEYKPTKKYTWYDYQTSSWGNTVNVTSTSCYSNKGMTTLDDCGITVKGEEINQQLNICFVDTLETDSTVITLKLIGYDCELKELRSTREKIQCKTCGDMNKSVNKYCKECGTFLE